VRWRLLNASAPTLQKTFEQENFAFLPEPAARHQGTATPMEDVRRSDGRQSWRAVGQLYVEKAFGATSKARMKTLVDALSVALRRTSTSSTG
jgi:predicted metalloendopeptidase